MSLSAEGSVQYKLGHFEEALAEFSKAYERYPAPGLLFNIGQCHKMMKHHEQAIYFFQGYLRDKPDAPNRKAVEELIVESKHALDAERIETDRLAAEAATRQTAFTVALTPSAPTSARSAPTSPVLRLSGFVAAGVGLAALGAGIFFGVRASSDSNQLDQLTAQRGTWSSHYQSIYDDGQTAATLTDVLMVGGAVALAGGATLVILSWPKGRSEKASATTLSVTPGMGSLLLRGSF